mgnify:FL=1|nr:MAG TPA: restriction endonuclease [Caudoviricetes sp.]
MGKTSHGQSGTRLYSIWSKMRSRCNRKSDPAFRFYGAKGIKVCEEWENDFISFKEWAELNGYTDKLTIDRIDSKKGYSPDNCRWLTPSENSARVKFSRDSEAFKNAIGKGLNNWFTEYSDQAGVSKRVELINKIISELPNLGTGQLELVHTHIEWIKSQAESNKRKREADKTIKTYQEYKNGTEIHGSKENC